MISKFIFWSFIIFSLIIGSFALIEVINGQYSKAVMSAGLMAYNAMIAVMRYDEIRKKPQGG